MGNDERSASEVLLSMERELKWLVGQQKVTDTNLKLMLNQMNLSNYKTQHPPSVQPPQPSQPSKVVERPNPAHKPKSVTAELRPVAVQQRIVYTQDQRPVILADVKIFSEDTGTLMKHTRTNASGFWDAKLPGGRYKLEVKKGPNSTKQGFLKKYDITVSGDGSQELERKSV